MTAKVCVSVSATDVPEILGRVQEAEKLGADLIEARLDKLRSFEGLSKIASSVGKPLIATNRPLAEKGSYSGPETDRLKILRWAVEEGFEYADLEITTDKLGRAIDSLREKSAKIIVSYHDYYKTPNQAKMSTTLSQIQRHKPDISKIVTTAQSLDDNLSVLGFLQKNYRATHLVSFAMGRAGVWSRVLAPFYGADFTYASLAKGQETAPGQLTITELRSVYETLGLG